MNNEYRNNRLRDLREDNDLSQEKAAQIANLSKNSYIRYEKGERLPPADIIKRYAQYYKTSTDYILLLTNNPKPYEQNYRNSKFAKTIGGIMSIEEFDKEVSNTIDRINENWNKSGEVEDIPEIMQVALNELKETLIRYFKNNL